MTKITNELSLVERQTIELEHITPLSTSTEIQYTVLQIGKTLPDIHTKMIIETPQCLPPQRLQTFLFKI